MTTTGTKLPTGTSTFNGVTTRVELVKTTIDHDEIYGDMVCYWTTNLDGTGSYMASNFTADNGRDYSTPNEW